MDGRCITIAVINSKVTKHCASLGALLTAHTSLQVCCSAAAVVHLQGALLMPLGKMDML